jgi:hypothetical protein
MHEVARPYRWVAVVATVALIAGGAALAAVMGSPKSGALLMPHQHVSFLSYEDYPAGTVFTGGLERLKRRDSRPGTPASARLPTPSAPRSSTPRWATSS